MQPLGTQHSSTEEGQCCMPSLVHSLQILHLGLHMLLSRRHGCLGEGSCWYPWGAQGGSL